MANIKYKNQIIPIDNICLKEDESYKVISYTNNDTYIVIASSNSIYDMKKVFNDIETLLNNDDQSTIYIPHLKY